MSMQITFCPDSMSGGVPKVILHTVIGNLEDGFTFTALAAVTII